MSKRKKLTREQLAEALAEALNLLNGLDREEWTASQENTFHALAKLVPEGTDFWNNGTVYGREL
jgi:hypothetical protein